MALKIKISEVNSPLIVAMGGIPITTDFYARFSFSKPFKGFDLTLNFRFFFDTEKEDNFADVKIIMLKNVEQPTYNEEGEQIGTETIQSKQVVRTDNHVYITLQPNSKAIDTQTNAIFEQIKEVPELAALLDLVGEAVIKTNIGVHLIAKGILEDIFGVGSIEIDLLLA